MRLMPASPFHYYLRCPRKTLPLTGMIALSVFLINMVVIYMNSFEATTWAHNSLLTRFSFVVSKTSVQLDPETLDQIKKVAGVEWTSPAFSLATNVPQAAGYTTFSILGLRTPDMKRVMSAVAVDLVEGRLPDPGTAEVALDERILRAKELKLGDSFGSDLDDTEVVLGSYLVVGSLRGPVALGLASHEFLAKPKFNRVLHEGMLLHFVQENEPVVNSGLSRVESQQVQLWSLPKLKKATNKTMERVRFMAVALDILLLCTLAVAVGLIQYVFALQRLNEFAIMLAIGYTNARILGKLLAGNIMVMGTGWVVGMGVSFAIASLIGSTIFFQRGLTMGPLWGGILWTLPTPAIVALAGTITLAWELRNMDPVAILERRD